MLEPKEGINNYIFVSSKIWKPHPKIAHLLLIALLLKVELDLPWAQLKRIKQSLFCLLLPYKCKWEF